MVSTMQSTAATGDRVVTGSGIRLRVRLDGDPFNPPVLLSHALGTSLDMWNGVAARLRDRFYVIRYDSRGHALSDAPDAPYTLDMLGADALAVLDEVGCPRCSFVGLSMGGMTGMWLGLHASVRLDRLVLANTTPFIPAKEMLLANIARVRDGDLAGVAHETLQRWFGPGFRAGRADVVASYEARMAEMAIEGYAGSTAILHDIDLRYRLGAIAVPTLVIAGAEDAPPAIAGCQSIADAIPNAEFAMVEQAGHLSAIENPDGFADAVLAFLR